MHRHSTLFHLASAAILATVAVYEFLDGEPPDTFLIPMAILAILGVGSLVIAVVLTRSRRRLDESARSAIAARATLEEKMLAVTRELNEMLAIDYSHCRYVADLAGDDRPRDLAFKQDVRHRLNAYIVEILSHTAALFGAYTGVQCAASLKILTTERHTKATKDVVLVANGDAHYVFTYARDPSSRVRRSVADQSPGLESYKWAEHAAFVEVMHSSEQHGYFCSNDLKGLGSKYWNTNPRWHEVYNAIAVCALKNPASENVVEAMGFLCVDNMHGGFDDGACRELLECVASIIYYTFRTTEEVLNPQVEVENHGGG